MRYWLIKSDPDEFSFEDLLAAPARRTAWEGVRNYQARNFLRDMRLGGGVFVYHSSSEPSAVAGLARVVREAYPDPTQFQKGHDQHDPASRPEDPRWVAVDLEALRALRRAVTLAELRGDPELARMALLQRGSRLSVTPVTDAEWHRVLQLSEAGAGPPPAAAGAARAAGQAPARQRLTKSKTARGTRRGARQRKRKA